MQGLTFRRVWLHAAKHHIARQWYQLLVLISFLITASMLPATAGAADSIVFDTEQQAAGQEHAIINDLDITQRILGGGDAEIDDWPSMAVIATVGVFPLEDRFFCGATLVAERYVLTAAHCMYDLDGELEEVSSLRVATGVYDLTDDETWQETSVTNIIVHPGYDNTLDSPPNDIALLELSTTVDAPVGQLFAGESEDYVDTLGYILGWGATRYVNDRASGYPTILQEARVPLVSLETCNAPISYNGLLESTQMCAGYSTGAVDACSGDSGGPLYILDGGQPVQVGITSFGNGCAQPEFYGIYTDISHYIPWLSDYISVPEQSEELIASRQAEPVSTGALSKSGGGAMNPVVMMLLMVAAAFRLTACSAQTIEKTPMPEHDDQLELSERGLRAGVNALQLGNDREIVLQALPAHRWHTPICHTGKVALRAKGRLFMTEQCTALAIEPLRLADRQVISISYLLIAQKLARLDLGLREVDGVVTAQTDAADNSARPELGNLLHARFQQAGAPDSWRQGVDQIRLLQNSELQFIDGELGESLPMLFDSDPDFD